MVSGRLFHKEGPMYEGVLPRVSLAKRVLKRIQRFHSDKKDSFY